MTTSRSTAAAKARPSRYRRLAGGALAIFIALAAPIRADNVPANLLPNYTVASSFSGRARHTGANSVSILFDNSTTTYIGFNQSSAALYINFTLNEPVAANAYGVGISSPSNGSPGYYSPAYGIGHRFATGSTVTCSITEQDGVFTDGQGGKYVFGGYALYTNVDLTPLLAQSGTGASVTYVQESHSRLVWNWTLAPFYVATNGNDGNDGLSTWSWAACRKALPRMRRPASSAARATTRKPTA